MKKTVVINVVGLTQELIEEHTPFLKKWVDDKSKLAIQPILPAVTCSMQATYLTGQLPSEHGIVGNGWYSREDSEIKFWKQSNQLIKSPIIWDVLKQENENISTANMFWWYNMYSGADYSVTPRPLYPADGRKIPDCYSSPMELRDKLTQALGTFPLFDFWGPRTSIKSSQWIASASMLVDEWHNPTLTFIYLPHLDYNGQRHAYQHSSVKQDLKQLDALLSDLIKYYEDKNTNIILLSEYGITPVNNPIHINRVLRQSGYITIKNELGLEQLDAGASKAFAVADHQIAHVYVKNKSNTPDLIKIFNNIEGIKLVISPEQRKDYGLAHDRAGDIILVADANSWFTYYFWLDDSKAPDFARTVDIHRKPGYDPVEMIANPKINFLTLKVIAKLIKKKLGFRYLMDIIPLDATLIKGSHGRIPESMTDWPVFISNFKFSHDKSFLKATEVYSVIKDSVNQ